MELGELEYWIFFQHSITPSLQYSKRKLNLSVYHWVEALQTNINKTIHHGGIKMSVELKNCIKDIAQKLENLRSYL